MSDVTQVLNTRPFREGGRGQFTTSPYNRTTSRRYSACRSATSRWASRNLPSRTWSEPMNFNQKTLRCSAFSCKLILRAMNARKLFLFTLTQAPYFRDFPQETDGYIPLLFRFRKTNHS